MLNSTTRMHSENKLSRYRGITLHPNGSANQNRNRFMVQFGVLNINRVSLSPQISNLSFQITLRVGVTQRSVNCMTNASVKPAFYCRDYAHCC